jgi:HEAT repeat protein
MEEQAQRLITLARQEGTEALPELRTALRHADPWMRLHAVAGLSLLHDPRAIDLLVGALHDPSFGVDSSAAKALANAGRIGVIAVLRALESDTLTSVFLHGVEHVLHHAHLTPEERSAVAPVLDALHRPAAELEGPMLAATALERLGAQSAADAAAEPAYRQLHHTRRQRGHIFPGPQTQE